MTTTLRLYTDFVCPFCFIAEQATVPRLLRDFDLKLEWHGFELHPQTPRGGKPLTQLFPGADLDALHARTKAFAAGFGVTRFSPPSWLSNTRRALAMAEYARQQGQLEPFRTAVFEANFVHGKNIEDSATLLEIARFCGFDGEQALAASDDPLYLDLIDHKQSEARRAGISGIPTFVIGTERIVGCQPYERLAKAVQAVV